MTTTQPNNVSEKSLNLPNAITLSRIPLMFVIVGLMYAEFPYAATIAFWLFIVAALTDWLDGKIARERGEVSSFGRFMDTVLDKVMVIGLMIALVNGGTYESGTLLQPATVDTTPLLAALPRRLTSLEEGLAGYVAPNHAGGARLQIQLAGRPATTPR